MFKYKIDEEVMYKGVKSKIANRTLVEEKDGKKIFYKLDNGISNIKEWELSPAPKYIIKIECSDGATQVFYADDITDCTSRTITFNGESIEVDYRDFGRLWAIKLSGSPQ